MINFKNYFFFFIYILFNPRLVPLIFRRIYIPVFVQYEWLRKFDIKTIIDVGAYHGHVSQSLHYFFPDAKIYAFEPIEQNYIKLEKTLTSKNIILNKIAISNKIGQTTFYINKYIPASSLLQMEEDYGKKFPFMTNVTEVKVETTTLDSYFKNKEIDKLVFLKLDTQGTENLILQGGQKFLKNVSIIHIETSFENMYKKQGLFKDVYGFLTGLEFKYMGEAGESQFYPIFNLSTSGNSIFINTNILRSNQFFEK